MANQIDNEFYRDEYNPDFVSNWDDLIGWEGREAAERAFFERQLRVHECQDVADIACGTGFHSIKLAEAGFDVTATDGSENMMNQTVENAKARGVKLADARVVDWRDLRREFGSARFDALVCLGNAFTHLRDHEARREALTNMFAVLKPGGLAIIDHRNYDSILDRGFSTKHQYYYTGDNVDARPVAISRTLVKFEYSFPSGAKHHLHLYPLRQEYVKFLLEDAGFVDVTRYGDFERPYEHYDPDFIQQVAFKPRRMIAMPRSTEDDTPEKRTERLVRETKRYYDGAADQIYKDVWGENIHLGRFEEPGMTLQQAMQRSNERMLEKSGLKKGDSVIEVGCGYGALARYIARERGAKVLATNISEREIEYGKELTEKAGLTDKVELALADFHKLSYDDESFDSYWSQEAFLHAVDKSQVLAEAARVLKPGGQLVFTDITVSSDTPDEIRQRIYSRVNAPDMWDADEYRSTLLGLDFTIVAEEDWSENVAKTYAAVLEGLEARRKEFEERIGVDLVDRTAEALQFWVDQANAGLIGWVYFVAEKPTGPSDVV